MLRYESNRVAFVWYFKTALCLNEGAIKGGKI